MTVDPSRAGDVTTGEAQAPGTTTQEPQTELTPEQVREENRRLREAVEQSKREKSNLEEARRRAAELEEQNRLIQARLDALTMQGGETQDDVYQRLMRANSGLTERAQQGDDDALMILSLADQVRRLTGATSELNENLSVAEAERQAVQKVRAEARKNGEIISVATARKLLQLDAQQQAAPRESERPAETIPTRIQPVPAKAGESAFPTTTAEYREKMVALEEAGDDAGRDKLIAWRRANPGALKIQ